MDTDELSDMAYEIIVQASLVSDTLKAELGAMCQNYKNENDWLRGVQEHCREILADPAEYVDFWNLEEEEKLTTIRISELADVLYDQMDVVLSTPLMNRSAKLQKESRL